MAIVATNLTGGGSASAGSSFATSSITIGRNKLALIAIMTADSVTVSSVTGCSLTWSLVVSKTQDDQTVCVYKALGGAPTTGSISVTLSGSTRYVYNVAQFSNVMTGNGGAKAIIQSAGSSSHSSYSLSVTLSAFSNIKNATYGAFGQSKESATPILTEGSGFTELDEQTGINGTWRSKLHTEFKNTNDTSVDSSSDTNTYYMGVAVEIKHITGKGTVIPIL